jgi:hypothetical protein
MKKIAILPVLVFSLSCSQLLDLTNDEKVTPDGNDQITEATPYTIGQRAELTINPLHDVDYYFFHIAKGGVLRVNVTELPDISISVDLLDKEGVTLKYGLRTGDSISIDYLAKPGDYHLRIESGLSEVSEKVFSFIIKMDSKDTLEWNNDTSNAVSMVLGQNYRGTIFPVKDEDFYRLKVDSNIIMRFLIDSVSLNVNMELSLYDFEFTNLATWGVTSGELNQIGYSLKAGTYYAVLGDKWSDRSSEIQYSFSVRKDTTDPTEWNDDTAHACKIALGVPLKAAIYPAGDDDIFQFDLPQSDSVLITIDSISTKLNDFKVYLFDGEFTQICSSYGVIDGRAFIGRRLDGGRYFIELSNDGDYSEPFSERRFGITVDTIN